jgi:hypothetical protein
MQSVILWHQPYHMERKNKVEFVINMSNIDYLEVTQDKIDKISFHLNIDKYEVK